ncbi:RdgB/HAM1 family non-canonical purine NTP pyrophosphatase [Leptolyngbya sp. FACHB-261]|uniref:RdgB/HAM1 family non-canonical purine NTP pyrophosphatase n=1 Tax=Leptolyngbya sp. FACHB-261 TaxID=2692806 RepID=UPI001687BCE2|nr:RdgB/HAM1 family non-canonical purine NTP pyrophosphatase [Leptolyngbya sp. FACHB-261]MBD2103299.1 RdgB/HAM1 family non-canonical purine NTP pyrophosphatase [Leptolyngbya sp. FACHB-261]
MPLLVLATSNPGKLQEFQELLAGLLGPAQWELSLKPESLEVEETGDTFRANACLKASQVAQATRQWAIADDSGLEVDALDGAPGIYSARYGRTDPERIERLLGELGNELDRTARFVCEVAVARPDGSIALEAKGSCEGEILRAPRGSQGFGYDPIFYVPQYRQTFAEMDPALKQAISHRGLAFADLLPELKALLA